MSNTNTNTNTNTPNKETTMSTNTNTDPKAVALAEVQLQRLYDLGQQITDLTEVDWSVLNYLRPVSRWSEVDSDLFRLTRDMARLVDAVADRTTGTAKAAVA